MNYDDIAAYFLIPSDATPPAPALGQSKARRLRDSIEAVATIGWWSREAATASTDLGHGFFDGYVWGRAAALGPDVSPSVVVAAFGVFEPSMLAATYLHGRSISSAESILTARATGAASGLQAACSAHNVEVAQVEIFGSRLMAALAGLDGLGRILFSALRALPCPEDPFGRAWRAAELVREHRGDGHVAALATSGLDVIEANVLTECRLGYTVGEYSSSRGFSAEHLANAASRLRDRGWLDANNALTTAGTAARDAIETATDRSQDALITALGDDVEGMIAAGNVLSAAVLSAHAAPADPRKRAAG
jgi:hypothetical protein